MPERRQFASAVREPKRIELACDPFLGFSRSGAINAPKSSPRTGTGYMRVLRKPEAAGGFVRSGLAAEKKRLKSYSQPIRTTTVGRQMSNRIPDARAKSGRWFMRKRIVLEPELEEIAKDLNASQRRALAGKLERWANELRVSAVILDRDAEPRPRPSLKRLSSRRLLLN
jgi:hypothetical protein